MKKYKLLSVLLSAFLCLSLAEMRASHFSAGEVFYEWIGDEPGKGQFDYRVYATIYRNVNGAAIVPFYIPLDGCAYRTSTGASIPITLNYLDPAQPLPAQYRRTASDPYGWLDTGTHPLDPDGWDIPVFGDCATSPKDISEYRFVGEVTLTGAAPDWKFAIFPLCCRDGNDNLTGGGNLHIDVDLNNLRGPNSSPRIIAPAARAFCVLTAGQKPFEWVQTAADENGDSLTYGFYADGSQRSSTCGSPTQIPYVSPYTAQSPLPSSPAVQINQQSGIFTFSPTVAGSFVVKIEVRELRFDTIRVQWVYIGNTVRELQVPIATACLQNTQDGPELDLSQPNVQGVSITRNERDSIRDAYSAVKFRAADSALVGGVYDDFTLPVYSGYRCFENRIRLTFDVPIKCRTATPTDFRLIGPDGVPRPINDINTNCQFNETDNIDLILHQPLDQDGNYLLQIRQGNDGNTLENSCGFELIPFYSAIMEVTGCPEPEYQLDGLTVLEDKFIRLDWSGNADLSDTNVTNAHNHWAIVRGEENKPPTEVALYDSALATHYVDSFGGNGWFVDNILYDYAIYLVYNGKGREWTRFCRNVLLRQDTNTSNDERFDVYWTPYNCIPDSVLEYAVYHGEFDSATANIDWELETVTATDTSYSFDRPFPVDSAEEGTFAVRVIARNQLVSSARTDSSQSNFIFYRLIYYPPPPPELPIGEVITPNVITPNGDMINDRFYINPPENSDQNYEQISLSVYNRWGNRVFEDPNFQNRNTQTEGWAGTGPNGETLGDGVYFYVVELKNPATQQSETIRGNLTIMGNGS